MAAAGILLLLLVVPAVIFSSREPEGSDLTVGRYKISEEEYLEAMKSVQYDTRVQIQQQYGASYGEDFWQRQYGGRCGYQILMNNTVEHLRVIHAVYDLAVENRYFSDGSYEMRQKRLEAENEKRSRMLEAGEVIYGLKEYTGELFLRYEMSAVREKYCNDDTREGMDLTEEEIVEHYNSRQWIYGEEEIVADLEMARPAVIRELRELKYDEMIAQRAKELQVKGAGEALEQFTLENCGNE